MNKASNIIIKICLCILIVFVIISSQGNTILARTDNEKEVIIFIPGLMGSELFLDENKRNLVWFDITDYYFGLDMDNNDYLYPGAPLGWRGSKTKGRYKLNYSTFAAQNRQVTFDITG